MQPKPAYTVYILTHGRPNKQTTLETLRRSGYTGDIKLILDDEDPTLEEYKSLYSDIVLTFSKKEAAMHTDTLDADGSTQAVVFARNAAFDIAKQNGHEVFIVLDDDYTKFEHTFGNGFVYHPVTCKKLDEAFSLLVDFYNSAEQITALCVMQGGDFIGGAQNKSAHSVIATRKAMNFFICSHSRPFKFMGRINEDTNAYTSLQHSGACLFLSTSQFRIVQTPTQSSKGGLTEIYLELGTYVKSFYTVMLHPSGAKVKAMGDHHMRLHHSIKADATYPKIIRETNSRLKV